MKIIRLSTVLLAGFLVFVIFTGCQEDRLANNKRARLLYDENVKLKKELEYLDRQNQEQKELLATCEKEKADIQKNLDDFTQEQLNDPALVKIIDNTSKQLSDLALENEQLKSRIKEFEAKLDQNSNQQDSP